MQNNFTECSFVLDSLDYFNNTASKSAQIICSSGGLNSFIQEYGLALVVAFLTLFTSLGTHWFIDYLSNKNVKSRNRIRLYYKLMGIRVSLPQEFFSRYEALIRSDYHEFLYHRSPAKDTIHWEEAIRLMKVSEDKVTTLTNEIKCLFEVLAEISVSFKLNDKLKEALNELYSYKTPHFEVPAKNVPLGELEVWKDNAIKAIHTINDAIWKNKIDAVIELIKKQL